MTYSAYLRCSQLLSKEVVLAMTRLTKSDRNCLSELAGRDNMINLNRYLRIEVGKRRKAELLKYQAD